MRICDHCGDLTYQTVVVGDMAEAFYCSKKGCLHNALSKDEINNLSSAGLISYVDFDPWDNLPCCYHKVLDNGMVEFLDTDATDYGDRIYISNDWLKSYAKEIAKQPYEEFMTFLDTESANNLYGDYINEVFDFSIDEDFKKGLQTVVVYVRGGNVVSIESSDKDIFVEVVDYDNMAELSPNDLEHIKTTYFKKFASKHLEW